MMCKRLAQVPMLCVPIYNMKLAMMQKTPIFITFSAHTKMAADKRGQIEVFARIFTIIYLHLGHLLGKCRYIFHTWSIWLIDLMFLASSKPGHPGNILRLPQLADSGPLNIFEPLWTQVNDISLPCSWKYMKINHLQKAWFIYWFIIWFIYLYLNIWCP